MMKVSFVSHRPLPVNFTTLQEVVFDEGGDEWNVI